MKEIKQKIAEGYLHVRIIVEVVGKPKEFVEESLTKHITDIKADKRFTITKEEVEKAEEQDNFYTAFAELEILAKDMPAILSLCFDYMPSSIEILEPEAIQINNSNLSGFLNDMQARLHAVNTSVIQLKESNRFFIKSS